MRQRRLELLQRDLGNRIQWARIEHQPGLTQADLARPYYTREMIRLVERGERQPSLELLAHIAKRLGLTVAELLVDPETGKPIV